MTIADPTKSWGTACVLGTWVALMPLLCSAAAAGPVDFRSDVAPILEQHCLTCHNERDRRGGLSLESAAALRRGGASGPVIATGDPAASYLLDLVTPVDGAAEMPKDAAPLTAQQFGVLRRWIAEGATWPQDVVLRPPQLWSLQPLRRPDVPEVTREKPSQGPAADAERFPIRSPIDAFLAARLREAGLQPAPPADRRTLIRRLYLDLTGLPPTPDAVVAFVSDPDPRAYECVVDTLLHSPHFGERWGRHWLDLARYADSDGYLGDTLRPYAWVYRAWVIDAVNGDLPFDQFSILQLAGDLLENPSLNQRIATGFHRNTLRNTEAGVDRELYRTKEIVDRVNTTGMVWLGLTLGCAECHDHKHDPIQQSEFYRLYAFFNNADEISVEATRDWEIAEYEAALARWRPGWDQLVAELESYERMERRGEQHQAVSKILGDAETIDWKQFEGRYETEQPGWEAVKDRVESYWKKRPAPPATRAPIFAERTKNRRETFVHVRGVYARHGERVEPGTPAVLPPLSPRGDVPDRLDLARWLFRDDNPLTPRVAANRIWQHLFGRGLVATPNDFGTKGARPTHPELLDWLATEYRRLGWSRKALIRLIVTSSAYRMSSARNSVPSQAQLGNQLLWRQNSFRVNAEIVRDLALAASGLLDPTIGRRGIHPPLPEFVTEVGRSVKWPESQGRARYRRGMYIFFKRTVPYPMLMAFDAPDTTVSCSRRERSNTPLQALTLLNDPVFFECAEALGAQMAGRHGQNTQAAITDM